MDEKDKGMQMARGVYLKTVLAISNLTSKPDDTPVANISIINAGLSHTILDVHLVCCKSVPLAPV